MRTAALHGATLAWSARRTLVRLRWPGLVGLFLVGVAIAVHAWFIPPARDRIESLQREARQLSARTNKDGASHVPPTQRGQLSNFYAFFPSPEGLPALLNDVQLAAEHNGLSLEKGEYRLLRDPQFALSRYQITLPVAGSYAQVRGFVNEVLDRVPSAALEDLAMKRESVGNPQLEARVRFVLFVTGQ
jgi:Tfp pilus assembly protein PilO